MSNDLKRDGCSNFRKTPKNGTFLLDTAFLAGENDVRSVETGVSEAVVIMKDHSMYKKLAAFLLASTLVAPLAASAQDVPSYAESHSGVERIQGRIADFDGHYSLEVRDERGFIDRVQIHDGTIINPTGITLTPGMVVSIIGENDGDYFSGDEIDTPYTYYGGVPYYEGHPWNYYGAGFALGFFFGNLGWWHGSYFSGYNYGWNHGYRTYAIPNYRYGIWYHPNSWVGYRAGTWSRGYGFGYGYHPNTWNRTVINNTSVHVNNVYTHNSYAGHSVYGTYTGHTGYAGGQHGAYVQGVRSGYVGGGHSGYSGHGGYSGGGRSGYTGGGRGGHTGGGHSGGGHSGSGEHH